MSSQGWGCFLVTVFLGCVLAWGTGKPVIALVALLIGTIHGAIVSQRQPDL